jgi:hypothetical protein
MKTFILLIFLLNSSYCIQPTEVYLCNSTGGKKYHLSSTCRGLSNCQHQIIKTTLEKAKKAGKTLCKWED